jgi:hypothetical protein
LGGKQEQQFIHRPAHAPGKRCRLFRQARIGNSGHDRVRDAGQGFLVELGEGERHQSLLDDPWQLGHSGSQFTGEVVPGLAQISQALAQGLALPVGVAFLSHPALQCATRARSGA